jgi:hypothetical protein
MKRNNKSIFYYRVLGLKGVVDEIGKRMCCCCGRDENLWKKKQVKCVSNMTGDPQSLYRGHIYKIADRFLYFFSFLSSFFSFFFSLFFLFFFCSFFFFLFFLLDAADALLDVVPILSFFFSLLLPAI